jgi:hypothetical protein
MYSLNYSQVIQLNRSFQKLKKLLFRKQDQKREKEMK